MGRNRECSPGEKGCGRETGRERGCGGGEEGRRGQRSGVGGRGKSAGRGLLRPGKRPQQVTLLPVTEPLSRGRSQGRGRGGRGGWPRTPRGPRRFPQAPPPPWPPPQLSACGSRGKLEGVDSLPPESAPPVRTAPGRSIRRLRSRPAVHPPRACPPGPPGVGERGPADTPPAVIAAAPPLLRAGTQDSRPLQAGWPGRPQKPFFPLALPPAPAPPTPG